MARRTEPSENTAKVGARIRELRLARNMSLEALGVAAGLSKGHLSSVEHGLAAITVETINRVATGLRLPPMYLFTFAADDERARIATMIMDFPPREIAQLRKDVQARSKALAKQAEEPKAAKPAKHREP